jgi:hypothetical protein
MKLADGLRDGDEILPSCRESLIGTFGAMTRLSFSSYASV